MPPPGMGAGIGSQPGAQRGVRIGRGLGLGRVTLGAAVLPGHLAGEPLAHTHDIHEVVNSRPPARRAQKFPRAISFNAAFSTSASASSRLRVAFSRSKSFSRLASSAFSPPN
jgi:hypothetical protein